MYAYLPKNPCCLQQPSPADLILFTDTSGDSAVTPITGGASLQLTHTEGQYSMKHYTAHNTYGASSYGELGAMADTITRLAAKLQADVPYTVRVWFPVEATIHTDLLLPIVPQPLDKATATNLGSQALML